MDTGATHSPRSGRSGRSESYSRVTVDVGTIPIRIWAQKDTSAWTDLCSLGPTPRPTSSPYHVPARYPDDIRATSRSRVIPFSKSVFEMIIQQFNLPSSTPWAFGTDGSHFQRYNLDNRGANSPRTGINSTVQFGVSIDNPSQASP